MSEDFTEAGRQVLAAQPFSVLLGTEITLLAPGRAELRLRVTDTLKQQMGLVHGGVLAYLADNALTFAGATRLSGPPVTAEMKINYIRPATGDYLVARAEAISAGRTQSVVRCDIFTVAGAEEKLCAAAQGTIAIAATK